MRIAVVGSYGTSLTMRVPRLPLPGETLLGGEFDQGPGGKGSNQAIGAARLGADVSFLTAIGADEFGAAARKLWKAEGVDDSHVIVRDDAATMLAFIIVEPNGENRIVIDTGALDTLDETAVERFRPQIAAADLLVVSMEIPLPAVIAALRLGRELNTRTLLNPAPAQVLPADAWALIDVITPNQTEARILLGVEDGDDVVLARRIQALTGGAVVLTRGAEGAMIVDATGENKVAAVQADRVVDTTGAGDSFTAALAVSLAEGNSLADAAKFAAAAGAHTVSIAGVIPALPTRDQIGTSL